MNWRAEASQSYQIGQVTCEVRDGECLLRWHWPHDVTCVYIHKAPAVEAFEMEVAAQAGMKLYTREEYKTNGGYRDRLTGIGQYCYRIFPCLIEAGRPVALRIPGETNLAYAASGKSPIRYQLKERSGWFAKHKSVQIQIHTEVPVSKETLCYVKKRGEPPQHKDDGMLYQFLDDFAPGRTVLPEIQVDKHDFVRLFFTDGKRYGEIYRLIPE